MGENVYWHCTEYNRRKQKALCVWLHTMLARVGELPYAVIAGEALTIPIYQDRETADVPQPATLLGLCIFPGYDNNSICFIWDTLRNELVSFYPGYEEQGWKESEDVADVEMAQWRQDPVRHQVYTGTVEKPIQGRIRIGGETRALSQHAISILPTIQALLPGLGWNSDYDSLLHRNPESLPKIPVSPAIQRYWDDLFEQFAKE